MAKTIGLPLSIQQQLGSLGNLESFACPTISKFEDLIRIKESGRLGLDPSMDLNLKIQYVQINMFVMALYMFNFDNIYRVEINIIVKHTWLFHSWATHHLKVCSI